MPLEVGHVTVPVGDLGAAHLAALDGVRLGDRRLRRRPAEPPQPDQRVGARGHAVTRLGSATVQPAPSGSIGSGDR